MPADASIAADMHTKLANFTVEFLDLGENVLLSDNAGALPHPPSS